MMTSNTNIESKWSTKRIQVSVWFESTPQSSKAENPGGIPQIYKRLEFKLSNYFSVSYIRFFKIENLEKDGFLNTENDSVNLFSENISY